MMMTPDTPSDQDRRLEEVLAPFWQAEQAGTPFDRQHLLAEHPDLAAELAAFFATHDNLRRLADPEPVESPTWDLERPAPPGLALGMVRYFGDYELLGEIARGGMGVVYRARQVSLNRTVALKMILAGELATADQVRRFRAEAEAAANLDHPNIVPIYEVGEHQSQQYFSMKLIEGESLSTNDRRRPDARAIAQLLATVARAVHYAHQRGILHRDLKPANVLVDAAGTPYVTDFGLAKRVQAEKVQTHSGAVVGTPSYMAPEQAAGQKGLSVAADVYGLGAILYELLTGHPPFRGDNPVETLMQVLEKEPETPRRLNPRSDRDLEIICLKCLQKDPQRRYPSAEALAEDLERRRAGEPIRARPVGRLEKGWLWVRRNPVVAGLLAAVTVALVAGTAVSLYFALDAADQAKLARENAADAEAKATAASASAADAEAKAKEARASAADAKAKAKAARESAAIAQEKEKIAQEKEKIARENAAETRRLLGEFSVASGLLLEEKGDPFGALLWYAEQVRRDPDNEEAMVTARLRLTSYRRFARLPTLVQVISHQGQEFRATFIPDGRQVLTAGKGGARVWDAATGRPVAPLARYEGEVTGHTYNPNGLLLLTISNDNTVRIWDAATGRQVAPPMRHEDEVLLTEFSPAGRQVLTAGKGGARVWDAATGRAATPLLRLEDELFYATFSPDGRRVLTAGKSGAQIWDVATGRAASPLLADPGHWMDFATFSPDGRRVLSTAVESQTARIWDTAADQSASSPLTHQGRITFVAFSPDGRRALTASDDGTARVWDAASGRPVTPPLRHQNVVSHAAFSPDGRRVVTASDDKTARVWDAASGRPVTPPLTHQGRVRHAEFSPDGRRLLTNSAGLALVWDAATNRPVETTLRHQDRVQGAAFSPDGERVVTASSDKTARVWDAASGWPASPPLRHKGWVLQAAFSPDGKRVLTADKAGAWVWDAASGRPASPPLRHDARQTVLRVVFSPDGRCVLTASDGKTARVWDAASGQPVSPPLRHQGWVSHATFSPDGRRVLTLAGGSARVWDVATGKSVAPPPEYHAEVRHAALSPDGERVVTAGSDNTARVWDTATFRPASSPLTHQGRITFVAFSPDGRRALTASDDGTARVWDAATGRPVTPPLTHQGRVRHAAFGPDGRRVVTTSDDKTVRVWDAATGRPVSPPMSNQGWMRPAELSPDGRSVLIASDDKTVRVWDAATGRPVSPPLQHTGEVTYAAFSPDGRRLLTVSGNTARVWKMSTDGRPLEDLFALTQLWSGHRIDATGGLIHLTAEEFAEAWQKLRPRYPQDFTVTAEQAFAWHHREMVDCLREGNPAAAVFHAWHATPEWHVLWAALHP
jgi:WD40 repeat protein